MRPRPSAAKLTTEVQSCGEPGTPRSECCGVTMYGGAVCPGGFMESSCGAGRCPTGQQAAREAARRGAAAAPGPPALAARPAHGAGGSTAGHGGAGGGTAGSGGSGTGDLELPDCVKALVAPGATAGTCTSERTDGGALSEICFDSGVRASFMGDYAAGAGTRVVQVKKADGAPCYSFETSSTTGGEILRYVWKDAAGQVVATGDNSPFHHAHPPRDHLRERRPDEDVQCLGRRLLPPRGARQRHLRQPARMRRVAPVPEEVVAPPNSSGPRVLPTRTKPRFSFARDDPPPSEVAALDGRKSTQRVILYLWLRGHTEKRLGRGGSGLRRRRGPARRPRASGFGASF